MGLTHLDEARGRPLAIGHLNATWTALGEAAGCVNVGVRRIQVEAGFWSTPAHEHGRQEEIFYVLAGRGISWQRGTAAEIGAGDCIVYLAGRGAHTCHAIEDLDLLAFGPRGGDESPRFPRLGGSLVGGRWVDSLEGVQDGFPIQFVKEAEIGPPELPAEPGARPSTIVNLADVDPDVMERPRIARTRRNLGRAAGSVTTGLQHVEVTAGKQSSAQHCHSLEEEIFVVLGGDGMLVLGDEETPVRAGHVISRPAGTGVAHVFSGGQGGMTYLAYGTREPGDVCYYPRSNKVFLRGINLVTRVERLDFWDGED